MTLEKAFFLVRKLRAELTELETELEEAELPCEEELLREIQKDAQDKLRYYEKQLVNFYMNDRCDYLIAPYS